MSDSGKEFLFKVLVVGDIGVGKTSIIKRYVHNFFSGTYKSTIGVDFALKVLNWDSDTIIRLQLWDIAGQERFGNMTRVYYREAVGAMVVYDVTRPQTFDAVQKWKTDIDNKVFLPDNNPIPCVLLANKSDITPSKQIKSDEEIEQYIQENNFAQHFKTSAKENKNIVEAARFLVQKIIEATKDIVEDADKDDDDYGNTVSPNDRKPEEKEGCHC